MRLSYDWVATQIFHLFAQLVFVWIFSDQLSEMEYILMSNNVDWMSDEKKKERNAVRICLNLLCTFHTVVSVQISKVSHILKFRKRWTFMIGS